MNIGLHKWICGKVKCKFLLSNNCSLVKCDKYGVDVSDTHMCKLPDKCPNKTLHILNGENEFCKICRRAK